MEQWGRLLLDAVREGRLKDVDRLLSTGEGVKEVEDAEGNYPLHLAARAGNAAMVRLLLRHEVFVDVAGAKGRRPIHDAAMSGDEETVRVLLEAGASFRTLDDDRCLPAQYAAKAGSLGVLKALQAGGALVHWSDEEDATPLSWAVLEGHKDAARFIAQNGGDADETLMFLCECGSGTVEQARFVIDELGADPEWETDTGWRAAFVAARYRRVELLELLLDDQRTSQDTLNMTLAYLHPHGEPKLSDIALRRGADPRIAAARDRVRGADAFWTVDEMRRNLSAELLAANLEEAMSSESGSSPSGSSGFTL